MTILVCDLVDSTARHERLGEDAADDFRARFFAAMRAAVVKSDGEEVKNLGDGLLVVFRRSTVNALRCAQDLHVSMEDLDREDPVQLRIGISVGEVAEEDGDWFGIPVIEASRLASTASPGQTVANGVVRSLAGSRGGHRFVSLGPKTLKGITEPVEAWAVDGFERATVVVSQLSHRQRHGNRRLLTAGLAVLTLGIATVVAVAVSVNDSGSGRSTDSSPSNSSPPSVSFAAAVTSGVIAMTPVSTGPVVPTSGAIATTPVSTGPVVPTSSPSGPTTTRAPGLATIPDPVGYTPKLSQHSCTNDPVAAGSSFVTCWSLTVPENRRKPDARTITLTVYMVPSTADPATAPTVIELGPYNTFDDTVRQVANVVLIPSRGFTLTDPPLTCPEVDALQVAALALPSNDPSSESRQLDALQRCHDQLVAAGVDLSAYNLEGEVGDIADYMSAAGLRSVVLSSYATDAPAVFVAADRYPGSFSGIYLDNPVDPGTSYNSSPARDLAAVVAEFVDLCKGDPTCASAHPNLGAEIARRFAQFNAHPVRVKTQAFPSVGRLFPVEAAVPVDVLLDSDRAIESLSFAFHAPPIYGLIPAYVVSNAPATIDQVAAGAAQYELNQATIGSAAYLSYQCAVIPTIPGSAAADAASLPMFAAAYDETFAKRCAIWDVPRSSSEFITPTQGKTPTFVAVGALTPNPVAAWANGIQKSRPNTTVITFPTLPDYLSYWAPKCYHDLVNQFVVDPTSALSVDACAAQSTKITFTPQ